MLTLIVSLTETWPRALNSISYNTNATKVYEDGFKNKKEIVFQFVKEIKENFLKDQKYNITQCKEDNFSKIFINDSKLKSEDYCLYNIFIQQIIDSLTVTYDGETPMAAYSLIVNQYLPFAKNVYDFLINNAFAVENDKISALSVAGFAGYFYVMNDKKFTSYTQNYGITTNKLTVEQLAQQINKAGNNLTDTIAYSLFNDINYQIKNDTSISYIYVKYDFSQSKSTNIFISSNSTDKYSYNNTASNKTNGVMSSNFINTTFEMSSDFRIVKGEQLLNQKVNTKANVTILSNAMRTFPLRTNYTAVIFVASANEVYHMQHKCQSIVDSLKNVVSCADPPPAQNVAAITCSIILIVLVIGAWTFGCIHSKKVEEQQKALEN